MRLRQIGPDGDARPEPATGRGPQWEQRRNAVGLRQVLQIADAWELNQIQLGTLLGTTPRTLQRWRLQVEAEQALPLSADTVERMSYLLGIWKALGILFPTPANRRIWLTHPNDSALFNGQAPLQRMLGGQVADLYAVRRHLDGVRG